MTEREWATYSSRAAARRAAARRSHPDRGGDPAELIAAFADIDTLLGPSRAARPASTVTVFHRRRRPLRRWIHRTRLRSRRRRRYVDI
ncbi:hypothetical protein [Williamsia sp. DF01-3]|uniref:hypothetical protein n=1 Tax=Williamsia sp. DF01-3 TaxID=2934157 RepID=UPI001FF69AAB|nr:hypothetical protein [Williamsia sp. DF01-3]MCK0517426.1 hypothetical protein [Williamsia sp. DF01-3]